ncbi:GDCCVxC domain-containing (seleno)protein [Shimia biformata]|uniref:GDCCVxC domain-containing (seleno)protein n=1 Tax=Shimia biformata TaxID=1294299 RepID=UPI001EF1FCA7|nr:GDCCVxC domain-containing (seleno)protein [Shimia biformata]
MSAPILISTLTCPRCGHTDRHEMPTDMCMFFHTCADCGHLMRPAPGDCCVFCSFGDVPCPPVQLGQCCG